MRGIVHRLNKVKRHHLLVSQSTGAQHQTRFMVTNVFCDQKLKRDLRGEYILLNRCLTERAERNIVERLRLYKDADILGKINSIVVLAASPF